MIQPVFEELGASRTDQGLIAISLGLETCLKQITGIVQDSRSRMVTHERQVL